MGADLSLSFNFLTKPALNCLSFRKQSGVKLFVQIQKNFCVFGGALPLKPNLMHSVLSGSDVWIKLRLCSSTSQNYQTPTLLKRHCLYSCWSMKKMMDFIQLAEGENTLILDSTSAVEGGA